MTEPTEPAHRDPGDPRPAGQHAVAGPGDLGHLDRGSTLEAEARRPPVDRAATASTPATATRRSGLRAGRRRPRGRRGGAGVRLGHGAGHRGRARPVLEGRPHRRPAPALRRHPVALPGRVPALRHRRHLRRRHRRRARSRRRRARARRCSSGPRRRPTRGSTWSTSTSSAHRRPDHGGRLDLRHPAGQRPLDHGVDLVVHSATKGDGRPQRRDPRGGAGTEELVEWIWSFAVLRAPARRPSARSTACGASARSPVRFRTPVRDRARLAERLGGPPGRWRRSATPGSTSHPQFDLAKRQMALPGGLRLLRPRRWARGRSAFVESVELAQMASSLGGPETLVTHPASTTHVNLTPEELEAIGIGQGTIRVSVGPRAPRRPHGRPRPGRRVSRLPELIEVELYRQLAEGVRSTGRSPGRRRTPGTSSGARPRRRCGPRCGAGRSRPPGGSASACCSTSSRRGRGRRARPALRDDRAAAGRRPGRSSGSSTRRPERAGVGPLRPAGSTTAGTSACRTPGGSGGRARPGRGGPRPRAPRSRRASSGRCSAAAAPLKARLLDQARIAGIGNLLVDEILWRAGLDPARPARSSPAELRRLHRHLRRRSRADSPGRLAHGRPPGGPGAGGICPATARRSCGGPSAGARPTRVPATSAERVSRRLADPYRRPVPSAIVPFTVPSGCSPPRTVAGGPGGGHPATTRGAGGRRSRRAPPLPVNSTPRTSDPAADDDMTRTSSSGARRAETSRIRVDHATVGGTARSGRRPTVSGTDRPRPSGRTSTTARPSTTLRHRPNVTLWSGLVLGLVRPGSPTGSTRSVAR